VDCDSKLYQSNRIWVFARQAHGALDQVGRDVDWCDVCVVKRTNYLVRRF
jgi:hypothetical protein